MCWHYSGLQKDFGTGFDKGLHYYHGQIWEKWKVSGDSAMGVEHATGSPACREVMSLLIKWTAGARAW